MYKTVSFRRGLAMMSTQLEVEDDLVIDDDDDLDLIDRGDR